AAAAVAVIAWCGTSSTVPDAGSRAANTASAVEPAAVDGAADAALLSADAAALADAAADAAFADAEAVDAGDDAALPGPSAGCPAGRGGGRPRRYGFDRR